MLFGKTKKQLLQEREEITTLIHDLITEVLGPNQEILCSYLPNDDEMEQSDVEKIRANNRLGAQLIQQLEQLGVRWG